MTRPTSNTICHNPTRKDRNMNNDNYGKACGYTFVSDERAMESRRTIIRGCALGALAVLSVVVFLSWRGYRPCWGSVGNSDAWRDISGTNECFPFKVRDGKGFVYQGKNYDDPFDPVLTRADWTISQGGRTYVLFDINPGDMDASMFKDVFDESLWIGLLGKKGEVVSKIRLATGVKDISGIRRALRIGAYVSATKADGSKTIIPLRFPEPWPVLRPTGDVWKDFQLRQKRLMDQLWEDWPDNGSGYAADWVSLRLEEKMEEEYRKAIDALKAAAPSETRRAELDAEYEMARSFAWDFAGDSSATAANVHWGNFCDRTIRGQTMEVYLRNWLEAAENPDGWETVRRAKGTLYGVDFAATSGVAVISVSDQWLDRRRNGEPEPKGGLAEISSASNSAPANPSALPPPSFNADEGEDEDDNDAGYNSRTDTWTLLLRLSPMRLREEGGEVFAAYELIASGVLEASSYMVEQGRVRIGRSD